MRSSLKLMRYLKPYWKSALLAPLLMLIEVVMDLMQPHMVQRIVDEGIAQLDMQVILGTGATMVGFAMIGVLGGVGGSIFGERATNAFAADLRGGLFRKVQSLSFGNLDELETGQLITRLGNDVTQMQELVIMALRAMVRAPMMLIGSLVMAIITSPSLAMLLLVLIPMVVLLLVYITRHAYPLFGRVQKRLDELNTVLQENLAGVRVVKAFVRARRETRRFRGTNEGLATVTIRAARTLSVGRPFMMLTVNLGVIGTLWFGGVQVNQGALHVGQIIAFINYLLRTLMSLMFVNMLTMRLARASASGDRIQEVFDAETDVSNRPDALMTFSPKGRVAFEHVSFRYDADGGDASSGDGHTIAESHPVIRNVDFVADPGQTVAILGATGSGKTSLVNLIPRFYDVTEGRVTLDGVDVRDIDTSALRRHIGVALQESVLFTGTIRDNIRYGRPEARDAEVVAAAKAAQAHGFISEFPEGYDTMVGQRGVNLSGGQKQRIAIARALLTRPAVLILDDSTSSVDVETETLIQDALIEIMHERTSFVIAQRISTVLNADMILVLDDSHIAAQGTHHELMASSPIYRDIYDSQLGNGAMAHG